jgi:hypothetical protein
MLRLALIFALIMLLFDAVTATISKIASINYGNFALLAIVVYVFLGIYGGRTLRSWRALISVAVAAIVEATLGWYVAALIGPGLPPVAATQLEMVFTGVVSVIVATLFGAMGVAVGLRAARAAG